MRLDGQTLVFENEYRPHARSAASTGMGLSNLQQRFALSTGGQISARTENGRYVVRVPLARRESSRIA